MSGREQGQASVRFDAEQRLVVVTFRAFTTGTAYRDAMLGALALAERRRARALLCDVARMGITTSDDLTWWSEVWLPRARDSLLEQVATVSPHMPLARVEAERALRRPAGDPGFGPLRLRYFERRQAALGWLQTHGAPNTPLPMAA